MVAFDIADNNAPDNGTDNAITHRKRVWRVIEQRMTAGLRFKHQGEGRIACDVDGFDRVHLDRYR